MLRLHKHQEEAIAAVAGAQLDGLSRVVVQMATGAGKTVYSAALASRILEPRQRFLFLAHNGDLLQQARKDFLHFFPDSSMGIVQGGYNEANRQHVFASIPTIDDPKRLEPMLRRGEFTLVIADECHRALSDGWKGVLNKVVGPDTLLVGLTATPMRSDNQSLKKVFQELVYCVGIVDLLALDPPPICDLRGIKITIPDLDLSQTALGEDGDFDEESLQAAVAKSELRHKHAIDAVFRYAHFPNGELWPGLFFGAGVQDCRVFAELANASGIRTEVISAKTKRDERDRIEIAFVTGELDCIANYGVYTEGKNLPAARYIIMGRHTKSQGLYTQICGRAARTLPGEHDVPLSERSKKEAVIFDLADNAHSVLILPDMVGTTEEKAEGKTIREMIKEDRLIREEAVREIHYEPGNAQVSVHASSLFTTMDWRQSASGQWSHTSRGIGTAYVEKEFGGDSAYSAYFVSAGGKRTILHGDENKPKLMRIEHAFGAAEMHLKMLESKAQLKSDTAGDWAPVVRLQNLFEQRCPIPRDAKLTNAQVEDLWKNRSNWFKDEWRKAWWSKQGVVPRSDQPVQPRTPSKKKSAATPKKKSARVLEEVAT